VVSAMVSFFKALEDSTAFDYLRRITEKSWTEVSVSVGQLVFL